MGGFRRSDGEFARADAVDEILIVTGRLGVEVVRKIAENLAIGGEEFAAVHVVPTVFSSEFGAPEVAADFEHAAIGEGAMIGVFDGSVKKRVLSVNLAVLVFFPKVGWQPSAIGRPESGLWTYDAFA